MLAHRIEIDGLVLAALLSSVPAGADADGGSAFFTGLGDLPGGDFKSFVSGISADGSTVVGMSASSADPNSMEAFRWTMSEGMVGLGDVGSDLIQSLARAASADGSVIVGRGTPDSTFWNVPFLWTASTGLVVLDDPTGELFAGQANDVSDDGSVIVGVGVSASGNQAFRWTASTGLVGLGWLPATILDSFAFGTSADGSVLCGNSFSGPGVDVEAFRWTADDGMVGLGDVPGGIPYAIAWDVSSDGATIVGGARTSFGSRDEMFVWRQDTGFVLPDSLHGATFGSSANAVSADGSIAVGYGSSGSMIWDAMLGMRSVRDILTDDFNLDLTGWTLGSATGISSDGSTIVGDGINPNGDSEAWIAHWPVVSVGTQHTIPAKGFTFASAGTNPFREQATFRLTLPRADVGLVRVSVFSANGRLVQRLASRPFPEGTHLLQWNGRNHRGIPVSAGIYLVRLEVAGEFRTEKVVRLR